MSHSLYLDLLQRSLTGVLYRDPPFDPWHGVVRDTAGTIVPPDPSGKFEPEGPGPWTVHPGEYQPGLREQGLDWPSTALTMIGTRRMENLRSAIECVLEEGIPGDLIEAGVWRGGACIYMRGILRASGNRHRRVFVADSFVGLPKGSATADSGDKHHHASPVLAVSLDTVRANFSSYDLLDEQVVFVPGWFRDTLGSIPSKQFALVRLDGDMYEATMDGLVSLYDRLSPGGFLIVDDYQNLRACKSAVTEFRERRSITEEIIPIDSVGVYWRKSK